MSLKNFGKGGGAEVERASRKRVLFIVDMNNDKQDRDYMMGWIKVDERVMVKSQ